MDGPEELRVIVFIGEIREIREDADGRHGEVSVGGARTDVALDLVPEARSGDRVLVHAGVALSVLSGADPPEPTPCA